MAMVVSEVWPWLLLRIFTFVPSNWTISKQYMKLYMFHCKLTYLHKLHNAGNAGNKLGIIRSPILLDSWLSCLIALLVNLSESSALRKLCLISEISFFHGILWLWWSSSGKSLLYPGPILGIPQLYHSH